MKRTNDFCSGDFDPNLLLEAWKVVIFGAGSENEYSGLKPKNAAMLSTCSSFFYEVICHSNQKEIRNLQQNFWKMNFDKEFLLDDNDELQAIVWIDEFIFNVKCRKMLRTADRILDFLQTTAFV